MYEVVVVKLEETGEICYCEGKDLKVGDICIVEVENKESFAEVIVGLHLVMENEITESIYKKVRKADSNDLAKKKLLEQKEKEAKALALEKIQQFKLSIKLIDVKYTFDEKKIIFSFFSEQNMNLENFHQELNNIFKIKVVLKLLGVRDETKLIGGYGICGRPLCCYLFKRNFESISVSMIKEQNLNLNPVKLTGICGRLMCCLVYEEEVYKEIKKHFPQIGSKITTKTVKGKVIGYNILKEKVIIEEEGKKQEINLKDILKNEE